MNICDLKFCRCTLVEYKNLDKHNADMLYFVSDGDKILLYIGDDSIQSVLTENILLDAMNDDVTISNFKSGDRLENVLKNALFNIVALSKKEFDVKSDIPEIGYLNNGKYLRISDDGTLIWDVAPKGEKGDKGDTGDTGATSRLVMVYRSGKSETEQILFTPTKPVGGEYNFSTNKVTLPNGWYSSDCDDKGRPLEAPIYMSSRTFSTDANLTETEWSTPIRITGDDGQAGTDGNSLEFIYYLTNDPDKNHVPIPHNDSEDEYVPTHQGWTDSPRGVDDEYQWEYFALRRKSNNSWSNWSPPALWSKYGVMGQDGDGVQYIYKRTTSSGAPEEELTPSNWDEPTSDYQTLPEYVVSGYEWFDNPQGVTEEMPYEWVAVRKFCSKNNGKKMWQPYEPAKLWAKFGEKGRQGEPGEPGQNGALTKFVMLYASGTDDNGISGPSGIGYDFGEHKLIMPQDSIWQTDDSGLTPPIFMSSRTFASISELTDAEWSTPVRITGADGEAGADGDNIEFIYFLTDSDEKKPGRPSITDDLTTLEPLGWSDNPKGVEETKPYEYFSMRRTSNGSWGEWSEPALWSKYGTNGQDGDGVQYIYINTVDEENKPDDPTPEDWRQPYSEYQTLKEFKPSNWNDNPKGVSKEDGTEFEWVSMRKFQYDAESGKKMWSRFSEPKIWARLAKDGVDGAQGPQGEKGEKGDKGDKGDAGHLTRLYMIYKGGANVETPTGGSYNFEDGTFECPAGWQLNDSELERPIWISSRLFSTSETLQDTEWSTPICITGADGDAGKDGTNVEFIYKLSSSPTLEDSDKPIDTNVDKNVPSGWTPSPQGVKRESPYEFFSMRMKNDGVWGNWSEPAVWSKFGMNGQDGDGVEYIYYRDNTGTQPTLEMPDDYETNEECQKNEWRPNDDWKDNPQGVQLENRYEWVSSRKYRYSEELGYKIWHEFSTPSLWAKFGEKGDKGEPGNGSSSKIVMLYASGESVTGLSTECKWDWNENTLINKPNEWHTSDSQLEPPVWMSSRIFSSDDSLNDVNWSTPVKITGADGKAGRDGNSVEFIYYATDESSVPQSNYPTNVRDDGYVPRDLGWSDEPSGISQSSKYEFFSTRTKNAENEWGDWSVPVLWSKYGTNGQDGDSVQYIYIRTRTSDIPDNPTPSDFLNDVDYQSSSEWIPTKNETWEFQWEDDPQGVTDQVKYEWVSSRKYTLNADGTGKMWYEFSTPSLWAKYGDKGDPGESVYTRIIMIYKSGETVSRPSGGEYDFSTKTFTIDDEGWNTSDAGMEAPIWMCSRTFSNSSEHSDDAWSEPVRITGKDGQKGVDGNSTEFIYYISERGTIAEAHKLTEADSVDEDGYVPSNKNWTNNPTGVSQSAQWEFCATRTRRPGDGWSSWTTFLWAKFGENGQDGDGVQYIYHRNNSSQNPLPNTTIGTLTPSDWQINPEYQAVNSEFIMNGKWSDEPLDVEKDNQYVWMSSRKYCSLNGGPKMWQKYSIPTLWAKYGKDGADGADGNDGVSYRTIMLYKSGYGLDGVDKLGDTMGDYNFTTHTFTISDDTWKMNDSSLLPPVYMSSRTFASIAAYNNEPWTDPIRITGADGVAGKDGDNIEFIFFGCDYDEIPPKNQLTPEDNVNTDGYCPKDKGWTNNPTGIAENKKYEFMSSRRKQNEIWTQWNTPVLWSKYGVNGQDGDGIEYVYTTTDSEKDIPTLVTPTDWSTHPEYQQSEYKPLNDYGKPIWTDNPSGVKDEDGCRVEWVSSRKYCSLTQGAPKMWQEFSTPKVWARFSKDGVDGQEGPQGEKGEQGIDGKPADVKIQKYIFGSKSVPFMCATHSEINTGVINRLMDFNNLPLGKWNVLDGYVISDAEITERIKALDKYELIYLTKNPTTRFIKMTDAGTAGHTSICDNKSLATGGITFNTMFPNGDDSIHIWCLEGTQTHEYDETNKEWKLSDTIKWNLPLYKTKLQQSCKGEPGEKGEKGDKGDTGENGKLGKVTYPAGEFNQYKVYISTDVKSPYVMDGEDYYVLKDTMYWSGERMYYYDLHEEADPDTYKYLSINPEDMNDSNVVNGNNTNGVNFWCAQGCTNANFNTSWKAGKPSVSVAKSLLVDGKKYIRHFYRSSKTHATNSTVYVGHVVWTLNDNDEVVLASKFLYSTDGTPENIINDINIITFGNKTPAEDSTSDNPVWEKFESFEALYTKIGIIENGTIGSAVYSGDFMFSQQGVDENGTVSNEYQKFNPEHIYDSDSEFKPNICMNFKTGQMWACGGNVNFNTSNIVLNADNTTFDGNLRVGGFTYRKKNIIDIDDLIDRNGDYYRTLQLYTKINQNGSIAGSASVKVIDFEKIGNYVEITGLLPSDEFLYIDIPSTYVNSYHDNASGMVNINYQEYIRSMVGQTFSIYNNSYSVINLGCAGFIDSNDNLLTMCLQGLQPGEFITFTIDTVMKTFFATDKTGIFDSLRAQTKYPPTNLVDNEYEFIGARYERGKYVRWNHNTLGLI